MLSPSIKSQRDDADARPCYEAHDRVLRQRDKLPRGILAEYAFPSSR